MSFSSGKNLQNNINTTEAQTLSNKTLDNTNAIDGASIDNSDISTSSIISPNRSDVKKDTLANLQTYALTATNGQHCFATDSKKMYQVLDNALAEVGSGSGGINYITNSDAEVNADGWENYANTTPGELPDDFGGTVDPGWVGISASATNPLRGTKSFVFGDQNASGASLQGHGVYSSFQIDPADKARKMTVSFDYLVENESFVTDVDGRFRVYIYDETNSQLIRVNGEDISAGNGKHYAQFQTNSDSVNYRLVIHQAISQNVIESYDFKFDNVQVGPTVVTHGGISMEAYNTVLDNNFWNGIGVTNDFDVSLGSNSDNPLFIVENVGGVTRFRAKKDITYTVSVTGTSNTGGYAKVLNSGNAVMGQNQENGNTYGSAFTYGGFLAKDDWIYAEMSDAYIRRGAIGFSAVGSLNAKMSEDFGGRDVVVIAGDNDGETITGDTEDIPFKTIDKDSTSSWQALGNTGSGEADTFLVPETGEYIISGSIDTAGGYSPAVRAYIDGVADKYIGTVNTLGFCPFNGTLHLNKGQKLTIRINLTLPLGTGTNAHYIHIQKLASPQTILETETVAARYTSNSGQSVSADSVVEYEDIDYDTHNAYNTSTGIYTVPVSGYYQINSTFTAFASWSSGNGIEFKINVNGLTKTNSLKRIESSITSGLGHQVSDTLNLNKSDTLEIVYDGINATLSTSSEENVFSIIRIK